MKGLKNILFSFTSILLIGVLNLPSFVKLSHALNDHKEQECNNPGVLHFHEVELDCDFNSYNLSTQLYTPIQEFIVHSPIQVNKKNTTCYFFLSKYQKLPFQLRGPPTFS